MWLDPRQPPAKPYKQGRSRWARMTLDELNAWLDQEGREDGEKLHFSRGVFGEGEDRRVSPEEAQMGQTPKRHSRHGAYIPQCVSGGLAAQKRKKKGIMIRGEERPRRCAFPGCMKAGTAPAHDRVRGAVAMYCQDHADSVADKDEPECLAVCPNCNCHFGVD